MGVLNNHPRQGEKRSLHHDVDASAPEALVDVSWAYLGPGALLQGAPDRDRGSVAAPGRVGSTGRGAHTAASPLALPGAPSRPPLLPPPALRLRPLPRARPRPHPGSGPPRPAPPQVRVRADGVRVVAGPPAMLPGVDHGPALRMDLHPVHEGIVFVVRRLELRELGDDAKGQVETGVVPVTQLARFWSTVTVGLPEHRPVIVRLRSAEDAELLTLLRALAPAEVRVVSYRLDEAPVGTQRSSYLLPDVDADAVAQTGAVRIPLDELRPSPEEAERSERLARLHMTRRRVERFVRRSSPTLLHSMAFPDPAAVQEVYVDGSVLRGARMGGAAAIGRPGPWAALPLPGATMPLEAELEALALGHLVAAWGAEEGQRVTIRSDSRAALALLRDAHRERLTLGGARGERIRRSLRRLLATVDLTERAGVEISTTWVKGHAGTHGNEVADDLARSAARNTAAGVSTESLHRRLARLMALWEPVLAELDAEDLHEPEPTDVPEEPVASVQEDGSATLPGEGGEIAAPGEAGDGSDPDGHNGSTAAA